MANVLRSEFLGASLQRTEMKSARAAERVQTQALFNKKASPKKAASQAKGTVKSVQKKVQKSVQKAVPQKAAQAFKKGPQKAVKAVKKATGGKGTKGWFGGVGGASDLDRWYGEYTECPHIAVRSGLPSIDLTIGGLSQAHLGHSSCPAACSTPQTSPPTSMAALLASE